MNHDKSYRCFDEQASLIIERGMSSHSLSVDELKREIIQRLKFINYYRLSAYWYPFFKRENGRKTDCFAAGTNWESVMEYYHFDRALRLILLDAISRFEISLRTQLAYCWGEWNKERNKTPDYPHARFGAAYKTDPTITLQKINKTYTDSHSECAIHYRTLKHIADVEHLPVWVFVEFCTFGNLTTLLSGTLRKTLVKKIAAQFGFTSVGHFVSTIIVLRNVRNSCAHQARVWNFEWKEHRNTISIPRDPLFDMRWDEQGQTWIPRPDSEAELQRWSKFPELLTGAEKTAAVLCVCAWLLRTIAPKSRWCERVKNVFDRMSEYPNLCHDMGFGTAAWKLHPLWQAH